MSPFQLFRALIPPLAFIALAAVALPLRHAQRDTSLALFSTPPQTIRVWTSTRHITALLQTPDGIWAATTGGVLRREASGHWRKWTRADGLPSHEARGLRLEADAVVVSFPQHESVWQGDKWRVRVMPGRGENWADLPSVTWRGQACQARLDSVRIGKKMVPLPPSEGTHISALLPQGRELWAALFGDGMWRFDGRTWRRVALPLPPQAREITALAGTPHDLWLGTQQSGLWHFDGQKLTPQTLEDEPFGHNTQAMAWWRGALWISTLEDGLVSLSGQGWKHWGEGELSSDAPRQLVPFGDALFVRHGGGQVDKWDGLTWSRDVFRGLPRGKILALAADEGRLYAAQWGGWSEWNGRAWTHHLHERELQGLTPVSLLPHEGELWIGTQSRGLARWNSEKLMWQDERDGLPDDWITTLIASNDGLMAGTFVGGLAWREGQSWHAAPALAGQNVTALCEDGQGGAFVATRAGVWHRAADGALHCLNNQLPVLDREAQSLCVSPDGLWVGTRTGVFLVGRGAW